MEQKKQSTYRKPVLPLIVNSALLALQPRLRPDLFPRSEDLEGVNECRSDNKTLYVIPQQYPLWATYCTLLPMTPKTPLTELSELIMHVTEDKLDEWLDGMLEGPHRVLLWEYHEGCVPTAVVETIGEAEGYCFTHENPAQSRKAALERARVIFLQARELYVARIDSGETP